MVNMYVTEEWMDFQNIERLSQKAGVPRHQLPPLIAKELMDNALDISDQADCDYIEDNGFYVRDYGSGLSVKKMKQLFTIKRAMVSSKIERLVTRGALGNGLRVVTGYVMATDSKMNIHTKGKEYSVTYDNEGNTFINELGKSNITKGTKVEIYINGEEPDLTWANNALALNHGEDYKGKTSPHWYNLGQMKQMILSDVTGRTLREFISMFDGLTGKKASDIASLFDTSDLKELNEQDVKELIYAMRSQSRPVTSARIGNVGEDVFPNMYYAKKAGGYLTSTNDIITDIPYMVEAWAEESSETGMSLSINKTTITGDIYVSKSDNKLNLRGCGLWNNKSVGKKDYWIIVNIQTPYMPIVTDGKEPNLRSFSDTISDAIHTAIRRVKRNAPKEVKKILPSQKEIILSVLQQSIEEVSSGGKYRFSERQLYYQVRPHVIEMLGKEPVYNYFSSVITDYEAERGDIPNIYRDTRGIFHEPHSKERLPLGTQMVEKYERPTWQFNKVLYSEKEGLFPALIDDNFPERHDIALLTSKGFASRAAKDLIDYLAETDEEVTFYCIHDADAAGTMIYQTLQGETKARGKRNIKIVNLGLDAWEGIELGLEPEKTSYEGKKAVADYVDDYVDDDVDWGEWLQSNRVELNAMKPQDLIEWLDKKILEHNKVKVLPPNDVLENEFNNYLYKNLEVKIQREILAKYDIENLVQDEMQNINTEDLDLKEGVKDSFKIKPLNSWRDSLHQLGDKSMKR